MEIILYIWEIMQELAKSQLSESTLNDSDKLRKFVIHSHVKIANTFFMKTNIDKILLGRRMPNKYN